MSDPSPQDAVSADAPALNKQTFVCPFCGAFTGHDWNSPLVNYAGAMHQIKQRNGALMSVAQCAKCRMFSVWFAEIMIFPAVSTAPISHAEMPDAALELYNEAASVLPHSRRAAAALVRASLERLLKDIDQDAPKGTNLFGYIDRVQSRVSTHLGQLLTLIRHVGNSALHEAGRDDDESVQLFLNGSDTESIELLFAATNFVVDELISRPKLVQAMYGTLPEGVRNAVQAAAAKGAGTAG